jgi:hypothetical protein
MLKRCDWCGRPAKIGFSKCEPCLERGRIASRKKRIKMKQEQRIKMLFLNKYAKERLVV